MMEAAWWRGSRWPNASTMPPDETLRNASLLDHRMPAALDVAMTPERPLAALAGGANSKA
jgi:hypothetical protein